MQQSSKTLKNSDSTANVDTKLIKQEMESKLKEKEDMLNDEMA